MTESLIQAMLTQFTYIAQGTYTASLTVSNANGTSSKTPTITVPEGSNSDDDDRIAAAAVATGSVDKTQSKLNTQGFNEQNNGNTAANEQTSEQKQSSNTFEKGIKAPGSNSPPAKRTFTMSRVNLAGIRKRKQFFVQAIVKL